VNGAEVSNPAGVRAALRTFACRCFAVAALSGLELIRLSPASAEQLVKFDSAAPLLHQAEGHLAGDGAKIGKSEPGAPIQGYLTRPSGHGPFPAVVLLHSCLGLPATRRSIADVFAGWGYVALFVDDFATRGIKETCAVDFPEGVSDAFGALAFLSTLPFVDPKRIGAVGYSQGADTALEIASSRFVAAFEVPDEVKFKVAAAFYPPCENQAGARLQIATLILVGGLDDVTPAADCQRLAKTQPGHSSNMKLVVYPGARHGFDNPEFADGTRVSGMLLEYDRGAAEQARAEMHDFLAAKLAR
jgi:dienelactone hydrolase